MFEWDRGAIAAFACNRLLLGLCDMSCSSNQSPERPYQTEEQEAATECDHDINQKWPPAKVGQSKENFAVNITLIQAVRQRPASINIAKRSVVRRKPGPRQKGNSENQKARSYSNTVFESNTHIGNDTLTDDGERDYGVRAQPMARPRSSSFGRAIGSAIFDCCPQQSDAIEVR
jgi:hypothetical protein